MKTLLAIFLALFLFSMHANAQYIQNPSFENWTADTAYDSPANMQTLNLQSFFLKSYGNTTKSTDAHQGTYSARLESLQNGSSAFYGLISNGIYDGQTSSGGVPYTSMPDSAFIWVKYNIQPSDTAAVAFFFKKMGNVYGVGYQYFTGVNNSWTKISLPISYGFAINPDSLIFMAVSSNPNGPPVAGSILYVDDVQFSGGAPSIPNGNFENWTPQILDQADDWLDMSFVNLLSSAPHIEKSMDAFDGNYSIAITSRIIDGDTFAFFSNANTTSSEWDQGQSIPWDPLKLTGRYKYIPQGGDTAGVAIRTTSWDMAQGKRVTREEQLVKLPASSTWKHFEVNFIYNSHLAPVDTLQLAFGSSNLISGQMYTTDGSKLWIDSLNLTLYPLGIEEENKQNNGLNVFPNPATKQINFQFDEKPFIGSKTLLIFDAQGKKVFETTSSNLTSINVSHFETGIYYYIIESKQKVYKGKFSVR